MTNGFNHISCPISRAMAIASTLHSGQTDLAGRPYILHPLRVMGMFKGGAEDDEARIVAVLYDVMEDCGVSEDRFQLYRFSLEINQAVLALTRYVQQDYSDHIRSLTSFPLDVRVSIADPTDHLGFHRDSTLKPGTRSIHKYADAPIYVTCQGRGLFLT